MPPEYLTLGAFNQEPVRRNGANQTIDVEVTLSPA